MFQLKHSDISQNLTKAIESLDKFINATDDKPEPLSKSCHELAEKGASLSDSGMYNIDPDGESIGQDPIQVYCDFETNSTQILHDKEEMIEIEKCSGIGCAVYDLTYQAPLAQISALISLSENCYQDLSFGCFLAPLQFEGEDNGFWTDNNGDNQAFFNGAHPGQHICACGEDQTCGDARVDLVCNCDQKSPVWTSDDGRITAKDLLPIKSFHYGPLKYDVERANITVGRLTCSGILLKLLSI